MQRDLASITEEIREVTNLIAQRYRFGEERNELVARFHELREEQKRARREQSPKLIYFLHAPSVGLVKIGYSSNAATRIASLHLSSPVPLTLLGTVDGDRAREAQYHSQWAHLRRHGEWFDATAELLAQIQRDVAA